MTQLQEPAVDLFRLDDIAFGNEHLEFTLVFLQTAKGDNAGLKLKLTGAHGPVDAEGRTEDAVVADIRFTAFTGQRRRSVAAVPGQERIGEFLMLNRPIDEMGRNFGKRCPVLDEHGQSAVNIHFAGRHDTRIGQPPMT